MSYKRLHYNSNLVVCTGRAGCEPTVLGALGAQVWLISKPDNQARWILHPVWLGKKKTTVQRVELRSECRPRCQ